MEKMFKEFGDKVIFIGISQDDREKIKRFVMKHGLSFPIVHDPGKIIAPLFNARIPTHFLIDMQGTIRYCEPSPPGIKDLENILK